MSTNRKLQKEIDFTLKRVNDGVDNFDRTHEKLMAASTQSLREKFEQELKKEIKKLQRCRDSIKNWMSGNDVKDKSELLKYRKLVESKMEQYKTVERESKMKAYSKEALKKHKQQKSFDKETQRYIDWLGESISQIEEQLSTAKEELEEIEEESDEDEQERLEDTIEKHQKYIDDLETTTDLLKNGTITNADVEEIKDGIEYYIEDNQEPEFIEDELIFETIMEKKEGTYEGSDTPEEPVIPVVKQETPSKAKPLVHTPTLSINEGIKVPVRADPVIGKKEPKKIEPKKDDKKQQNKAGKTTKNGKSSAIVQKTTKPQKQPAPQQKPTPLSYRDMMLKSQQKEKQEPVDTQQPTTQKQPTQQGSEKKTKLPRVRVVSTDRKLEQSLKCLPSELDTEAPNSYQPKNPTDTPDFFPQEPLAKLNDPSFFSCLQNDALFFAFYYQKGTWQQELAARELRKNTWRFHSKYMAWFQRHAPPEINNSEYEIGSYIYYDYDYNVEAETGWCSRLKSNFKFEYKYLGTGGSTNQAPLTNNNPMSTGKN